MDAHLLTVVGNLLMPLHGELHILEDLTDRAPPRAVDAMQRHLREATLGNDALSLKRLELRTVGSSFLRCIDEPFGLIHTTIEVSTNLCNKISRIVRTDQPVTNFDVLIEKGLQTAPVLSIDDELYQFGEAVKVIDTL